MFTAFPSLGVHTNVKEYLAVGGAGFVQTPKKIKCTSKFCAAKEIYGWSNWFSSADPKEIGLS